MKYPNTMNLFLIIAILLTIFDRTRIFALIPVFLAIITGYVGAEE